MKLLQTKLVKSVQIPVKPASIHPLIVKVVLIFNLQLLHAVVVAMDIIMTQQLMTVFYAIIDAVNAQVTPKISLYV